jgi:hypothetical protein
MIPASVLVRSDSSSMLNLASNYVLYFRLHVS